MFIIVKFLLWEIKFVEKTKWMLRKTLIRQCL